MASLGPKSMMVQSEMYLPEPYCLRSKRKMTIPHSPACLGCDTPHLFAVLVWYEKEDELP